MLNRLAADRKHFCPMLCNVCRYMDCRAPDDYECVHPLLRRPFVSDGIEGTIECGQQGEDCWLFRPRAECRTLELAEAFIRTAAVDARWQDEVYV